MYVLVCLISILESCESRNFIESRMYCIILELNVNQFIRFSHIKYPVYHLVFLSFRKGYSIQVKWNGRTGKAIPLKRNGREEREGYSSKIKSEGRNGSSILNMSFVLCPLSYAKLLNQSMLEFGKSYLPCKSVIMEQLAENLVQCTGYNKVRMFEMDKSSVSVVLNLILIQIQILCPSFTYKYLMIF